VKGFIWFCIHTLGFPRRWREFDGKRNVDVQTCAKCGARRLSVVQFGPAQNRGVTGAEVRL
jgi:hypothetical protein